MATRQRRKSVSDSLIDTAKKAEYKVKDALVVLWDDLPAWQQDNHYIVSGYRPESASFAKSFASLGYLHNESVNIFSHLIPGVGFVFLAFALYKVVVPRYESITQGDVLAFACFFAGAAFCLGMSATYHAICNHSHLVARFGNKLDYVGIVFLITGSFIPSVYYGFYCFPRLQEIYWTMVCATSLNTSTVLTTYIDMLSRASLCNGFYLRPLPYSSMAPLPSRYVCGLGSLGDLSCASRRRDIWNTRDAGPHWSCLGR